jgi:hypothetical protein
MGLSNRKEEQLKKMPTVESRLLRSKDGKLLIHKTIITDIKPCEYYKVVMESPTEEQVVEA